MLVTDEPVSIVFDSFSSCDDDADGSHFLFCFESCDEYCGDGMEQGFYVDGEFGIRIENVLITVSASTKHNFRDMKFLGFESATLVPIQTSLIDVKLLTDEERSFLNDYHARCFRELSRFAKEAGDLDPSDLSQFLSRLEKATEEISRSTFM